MSIMYQNLFGFEPKTPPPTEVLSERYTSEYMQSYALNVILYYMFISQIKKLEVTTNLLTHSLT